MVHLGVIGELGHPGFETIHAMVYISTDESEEVVGALWEEVLRRAPIVATVGRAASLKIEMKVIL
jgi:hypothetical protein